MNGNGRLLVRALAYKRTVFRVILVTEEKRDDTRLDQLNDTHPMLTFSRNGFARR